MLSTEGFSAEPGREGSADGSRLEGWTDAGGPFSKRKERSWIPPAEGLPPIVQAAIHLTQWFRSKCLTSRKENAQLRLVGQLALGAKRHISVVEVSGVRFLVGGGADNVTVIVPIATAAAANAGDMQDASTELRP
ncbi:MAG: flagellar biosynthetic protein FliO [Acidobacteriaceae bacterium]